MGQSAGTVYASLYCNYIRTPYEFDENGGDFCKIDCCSWDGGARVEQDFDYKLVLGKCNCYSCRSACKEQINRKG
jgi:hypothetical protein